MDPPDYSPSSGRASTQHAYYLENSKGSKWVTLNVQSRSATSKSTPLFFDKDVISGSVEVVLQKAESIKAVTISVTAGNTAVGQEEETFLNLTQDLWTPSPSSPKLSGKSSWSFSITLPSEVPVAESPKSQPRPFPLPPTFSERASPAYIDYKLVVTIKRGLFKVNQTLLTSFLYLPRSNADPPSSLRQLAYSKNTALVGPAGDPEGWRVLPAIKVKGTIFNTREVELEYKLAIATPSAYAIGSPLPVFLTVSSTDSQALNLLSTPSSVQLYLMRCIAIGSEATNEEAHRRSNNTFFASCGRAYWWPAEGVNEQESGTKSLMGEIDIKNTVKPSFTFPRFALKYTLNFFAPQAPGFVSAHPADEALHLEKVAVVTSNAPGVIPASNAPPGYVLEQEGDYNNAVGYLENGNQRFVGHHHAAALS
ncbi:hypothetical protein JAAARDRAFT_58453 [Jaapia argillacea MUCL 33604]|uniref:Arrestin-like N-terminal domain-containing protein n=1 Tax=Jaapia argillacea MUCL 33604 TaxID=933084 RepID=A0A067PQE5_9AGAM|nr:hypothetical protein JAAARDRAFT_58453 [Jaapia argillacea MUCL 33604]